MTLPASGTITMDQVNTELGLSSSALITLNDTAVRNLFGKPSGAISMSDGWGKSSYAGPPSVEYLVVGGGGGGSGGGGGAGGMRSGSALNVTGGVAITVVVGVGGALNVSGGSSTFGEITSIGGGKGADGSSAGSGGSGGGGCGFVAYLTIVGPGTGIAGQGYGGGSGAYSGNISNGYSYGGGGGGAGGQGGNAYSYSAGAGGAGSSSSITGTAVTYAAGGGGTYRTQSGLYYSGLGGGSTSSDGANGLGGGGGGVGSIGSGGSSAGGSGTVIIRYPNTYADPASVTGSPTVTNTGGYKIYQWTSVGTWSITF